MHAPSTVVQGLEVGDVLARLTVLLPAAARDTLLEGKVGSHKGRALVKSWRTAKSHHSGCQMEIVPQKAMDDGVQCSNLPRQMEVLERWSPESSVAASAGVPSWQAALLLHPRAQQCPSYHLLTKQVLSLPCLQHCKRRIMIERGIFAAKHPNSAETQHICGWTGSCRRISLLCHPQGRELWLMGKGVAQGYTSAEVVCVFTAKCSYGHEGL